MIGEGDDEEKERDEGGGAESGGDDEKWPELGQEHSVFKEAAKGARKGDERRKKDDKDMPRPKQGKKTFFSFFS